MSSLLCITIISSWSLFLGFKRLQKVAVWDTCPSPVRQYYSCALYEHGRRDQIWEIIPLFLGSRFSLMAVNILGCNNIKVSHLCHRQVENPCSQAWFTIWSLNCRVTTIFFNLWGLLAVGLFTTRLNNKTDEFILSSQIISHCGSRPFMQIGPRIFST